MQIYILIQNKDHSLKHKIKFILSEISLPFGVPVLPLVYIITAISFREGRRFNVSSSREKNL